MVAVVWSGRTTDAGVVVWSRDPDADVRRYRYRDPLDGVVYECRRCIPLSIHADTANEPWFDYSYRPFADWSQPSVYAPLETWTRDRIAPVFKPYAETTPVVDYYREKLSTGLIVARETWHEKPDAWFERVVLPLLPIKETKVQETKTEELFPVTDDPRVRELAHITGLDGWAASIAVREDIEDFTALLAA
jgi:hypothetical protein